MKTILIFLASSEELEYERMVLGNLIRRLDDVYEKRGIRLKLFEWFVQPVSLFDQRPHMAYTAKNKFSEELLDLLVKASPGR